MHNHVKSYYNEEENMPERIHEKRKQVKRKIGVDWWAVILALVALALVKFGIVGKIPW